MLNAPTDVFGPYGEKDLGHGAVMHRIANTTPDEAQRPEGFECDPRWETTQRIIASRHFARSPLLKKFLVYVVSCVLDNKASEITEHRIGVKVFDRPANYRTLEDNIVRNYARQLRRRLLEYHTGEGISEPLRIDIPLGGYVPVFVAVSASEPTQAAATASAPARIQQTAAATAQHFLLGLRQHSKRAHFAALGLLLAYSTFLVVVAWFAAVHAHQPRRQTATLSDPLWAAIFGGAATTYIVPSDAGLNLLEDISHRPMPLAEYIKSGYFNLPLNRLDAHTAEDMRTQHLTSFVDLQIVTSLERSPYFDSQRVMLRFPRELRLDDLKNANIIILGSVGSNPWAAVADSGANFRIIDDGGMKGAVILNGSPLRGEASDYPSHWNQPAHETFSLIQYLPNLTGTGHILLLQGLDVAGTQAAEETLLHPATIAPILRRATLPDGSLRPFEILLRSTSLESNATGTQVVASRIC